MHTYELSSFINVAEDINQACAWLQRLGIEYPKTRIGKYQKIFAILAIHQEANTLQDASQIVSDDEYINAGFETNKLLYIYQGLKNIPSAGLEDKLKAAVRGRSMYVLDDEHRSGRDFTFELTAAAMYAPSADSVEFSQDADVIVSLEGFQIFVECKRLKSVKKVEKRIKEGLEQLELRYDNAANPWMARGILALSIDKVANPNFRNIRANTPAEISTALQIGISAFIESYGEYWRGRVGARTLGVLIRLEAPAIVGPEVVFATAAEVVVDACRPRWSPEFEWLRLLQKGAMRD